MGNCFEAAFQAFMALPDDVRDHWRLCHGVAVGTGGGIEGKRYVHAWLEQADEGGPTDWLNEVRDVANGKDITLPKALYYNAGTIDPREVRRYTWEEAAREACQHLHYGCWEEFTDVYWGETNAPV